MGDERLRQAPWVLVVDEDASLRAELAEYLAELGYESATVSSGKEALALLAEGRFQAVISELVLPDIDGLKLIAKIKKHHPELDVLVLSSLAHSVHSVNALRQGASECLAKPVSLPFLGFALARLLSLNPFSSCRGEFKSIIRVLEASRRVATVTQVKELLQSLLPHALVESGAQAGACLLPSELPAASVRSIGIRDEHLAVLEEAGWTQAFSENPLLDSESSELPEALAQVADSYGGSLIFLPFPGPGQQSAKQGGILLLGGPELLADCRDPLREATLELLLRSAAVALANLRRDDETAHLAYRDDLTRLFNSRYLRLSVERELARECKAPFALIFLDLDKFKEINDTRGHLEGSRVLVELAQVLLSCVRDTDICTRYGGDEFCIVLPDTAVTAALAVAERLRSGIANHVFAKNLSAPVRLTASLGVALYPQHGSTWEELLASADRAMYSGKRDCLDVVVLAAENGAGG